MSNLYQSTTESLESLNNWPTCAPPLPCKKRRGMDNRGAGTKSDVELGEVSTRQKRDRDGDESKESRKLVSLSCVPTQQRPNDPRKTSSDSVAPPNITGSQESLPSGPSKKRMSRARSVRKSIAKNTLVFFGLDLEQELQRQKWQERRIRHCSKRYGKMKDDLIDFECDDEVTDTGTPRRSIVSMGPMMKSRLSKRESVPSMVFNGLKRRLSTKPNDRTHDVFSGRSFAPKDLATVEGDDVDFDVTSPMSQDLRDSVFFDFHHEIHDVIQEEPEVLQDELPAPPEIPERAASPALGAGWKRQQKEKATERDKEIVAKQLGIKAVQTHVIRTPSERRHRMQHRPVIKKKPKKATRRFGLGPFFTYWVSFLQVVILIVMVSVYSFAPVGTSKKTVQEKVTVSRNGKTQVEVIAKLVFENFWIGPSQEDLIRLGAKYAPCMRRDKLLFRTLDAEKVIENRTGCCVQTYYTGCIQTLREDCMTSFAKFVDYSPKSRSKAVCGQDPKACTNPASVSPHIWSPNDISKWPVCKRNVNLQTLDKQDYPHLRCEITGRPCCVGAQAKCLITSSEHCKFLGGRFHAHATLCSQVDCLSSVCGLLPFLKLQTPDQVYRLWLSLFLHAGIIHIIITLVFNFTILRDIEKMAGWARIAVIYLSGGIGGNLWSSVLTPYQVEVGPSGALFGVIACLFVELFQSWQLVAHPVKALIKMSLIASILFLAGLLPYVDNFAHIFGFIYGFLSAFAFLPYVTFGTWDLRRKRIQVIVSLAILIALTVVGCILFYAKQEFSCPGCEYLNCIPLTSNFCENSHKGQMLQPR
eukprot:gene9388-17092_t